jgi:hypothetical protein
MRSGHTYIGESWSVAADVYAFGWLMCEMDQSRQPYDDKGDDLRMLFLEDILQPSFSLNCPIADVARKCLASRREDRPTMTQVQYELRMLRQ